MTSADFDGNGSLDLAIASGTSNTVTVLPGTGGGSFGGAWRTTIGITPSAIITARLNGDAAPDLVVASLGSGSVTVLLGAGDGTFVPVSPSSGVSGPTALATADFDADGHADVAVAQESGAVTVLRGVGDGSFASAHLYQAGGSLRGLAAGDVDGDGDADLVAAGAGRVIVLRNVGDGTFSLPAANYPAGGDARGVAISDFDDDGDADVATTGSNSAVVLLGTGDGRFHPQYLFFATGQNPWALVASDFDGNGADDLAVANRDSNNVSVLLNHLVPEPAWRFGEGSGTLARSSPPGFDATLSGPVWTSEGAPAGALAQRSALVFSDGAAASVPDAPALDLGEGTWDAWVRFNRTPAEAGHPMGIVGKGGQYWTRANLDGALEAGVVVGGTTYRAITAAGEVQPGTWYHVTAAYRRAAGSLDLSVNGFLRASQGVPGAAIAGGPGPLVFGTSPTDPGADSLSGTLDEVRLFDRAFVSPPRWGSTMLRRPSATATR